MLSVTHKHHFAVFSCLHDLSILSLKPFMYGRHSTLGFLFILVSSMEVVVSAEVVSLVLVLYASLHQMCWFDTKTLCSWSISAWWVSG